jgi:hypothetical protein
LTDEDYTRKYNLIKKNNCTNDDTNKSINIKTCKNLNEEYIFISYSTINDEDNMLTDIEKLINICIEYLNDTYKIKYKEFNEFLIKKKSSVSLYLNERYKLISPLSFEYIQTIAEICIDNKDEVKYNYFFDEKILDYINKKFEELSKLINDDIYYLEEMKMYFTEILTLLAKHIYLFLSSKLYEYKAYKPNYSHILIMLKHESNKYYYNGHIFGLHYNDTDTGNNTIANTVYISTFQRGKSYCKYIVTYYAEILEEWYKTRSEYEILVTNTS